MLASLAVLGTVPVAGAHSAASGESGAGDVLKQANIMRIDGAAANDSAGDSVAGAGDVNGDGRADVLVGALFADIRRTNLGSAYVVFGQALATTIDLAALGARGFRIDGAVETEGGFSVASAGDVNGDGRADMLVGASGADNNARRNSGSAFVVFGKSDAATIDLAALDAGGFRIDGANSFDFAGASVAGVGDINRDGRAGILVGAPGAGYPERGLSSGSAYVVFGKSDPGSVDLAALGVRGFRMDGAAAPRPCAVGDGAGAGASVAAAGDVNGDGRADVLIGAVGASNVRRRISGAAYVVFGKTDTARVDLAALGARGFRIDGEATFDNAGDSVAGAGDVNGDGRADVLVGAPGADSNGREDAGSVYVVFGKRDMTNVDLAAATDTAAPKLVLGGPRSQRALRQKGVVLSASCSEACTLRASGTVALSKRRSCSRSGPPDYGKAPQSGAFL